MMVLVSAMVSQRQKHYFDYGDNLDSNAETKSVLKDAMRKHAHLLWKKDSCPEEQEDKNWYLALGQQRGKPAQLFWAQKGCPQGNVDE